MERSKAGQLYQWSEAKGKRFLSKTQRSISTAKAWQERAEQIRVHMLQATGLDPLPKKSPLNTIFGKKRVFEGYVTQNVAFESLPNVFVTGTLYWPSKLTDKPAGILSFHGHWPNREDYGRYRPDVQKRCATMARMGAVVLSIDMVGYGQMADLGWHHKHPETMKLQIWNGIRAIDFLETLRVDPDRIACTGASGGGTQTFHLAAIDPRISVSIPVVMVSYRHFGGCICELGMPIHEGRNFETNNVEMVACTAPNPLLLISVGTDATETTPDVEFPFIRYIYGLFGKSEMVENAHLPGEKHGYGYQQRAAAYPFLAKHLGLDLTAAMTSDGKLKEAGIVVEDIEALYLFAEKPLPTDAITNNEELAWD
ncbi:MAG: acetylxylan esterase [Saprospiraceae bacterium]|nr:acetylxylan esterase [Saprospiraceae bacterium]